MMVEYDQEMNLLILALAVLITILGVAFVIKELFGTTSSIDLSPYQKKNLFDTTGELALYKILLELYGDKYYVFPQINYNHIIEVKKMDWKEGQRYRNHIDRKSADFILCNKEQGVPVLIIELDGSAHNIAKKQKRDALIDGITKIIGLPILHLKNDRMSKEFVKDEVDPFFKSSSPILL